MEIFSPCCWVVMPAARATCPIRSPWEIPPAAARLMVTATDRSVTVPAIRSTCSLLLLTT